MSGIPVPKIRENPIELFHESDRDACPFCDGTGNLERMELDPWQYPTYARIESLTPGYYWFTETNDDDAYIVEVIDLIDGRYVQCLHWQVRLDELYKKFPIDPRFSHKLTKPYRTD